MSIRNIFKLKDVSRKLAVEEARQILLEEVSDRLGWKLLKSKRCIKKNVGDFVFEINFIFNKWNESYKTIEVGCACFVWCKALEKEANINSIIVNYGIKHERNGWIDISTEKRLAKAIDNICDEMELHILPLSIEFEKDVKNALVLLAEDNNIRKYNVRLDLVDKYIRKDSML